MKLFKDKDESIDREIGKLFEALKTTDPLDDKYLVLLTRLEQAQKLRDSTKVSPNVKAQGFFTLAVTGLVIGYEHAYPIASKAFTFIPKAIKL